jgi:hypothetical protein
MLKVVTALDFISLNSLSQGSQTHGPREGPMQPSTKTIQEILSHFAYFSKYFDFYTKFKEKKIDVARETFFESHVAFVSL